ncbi:MAG: hypothetical protein LUM44_22455 [Pyrinomonadaceae bacterium]|nr:hypothetical protein [Pyrinomonadaceae bacterium]
MLTHNAGPCWTSTNSKTSVENAFSHWKNHKAEFPELNNAKEYAETAKEFIDSPPTGALTKTRANGDVLVYDAATNTFGVGRGGAPATMFRPNPARHGYPTNLDYFNAQ